MTILSNEEESEDLVHSGPYRRKNLEKLKAIFLTPALIIVSFIRCLVERLNSKPQKNSSNLTALDILKIFRKKIPIFKIFL